MMTTLVKIWQPKDDLKGFSDFDHNFGDLLGLWIARKILGAENVEAYHESDPSAFRDVLLPIGTVIGTSKVAPHLRKHVWGCGWSGEAMLDKANTVFHAVRGPLTKRVLELSCPIGDPGLLTNYWLGTGDGSEGVIHIPHISHRGYKPDFATTLDPVITEDQLEPMLARISNASMVVCGAMHPAIVAASLGIPFAFHFPPDAFPEYPFKYMDLGLSLGVPFVPVKSMEEAEAWYARWGRHIRMPDLELLYDSFPK